MEQESVDLKYTLLAHNQAILFNNTTLARHSKPGLSVFFFFLKEAWEHPYMILNEHYILVHFMFPCKIK